MKIPGLESAQEASAAPCASGCAALASCKVRCVSGENDGAAGLLDRHPSCASQAQALQQAIRTRLTGLPLHIVAWHVQEYTDDALMSMHVSWHRALA